MLEFAIPRWLCIIVIDHTWSWLVLGDPLIRLVEKRLCKRELEHDLAVVVGDLDDGVEQARLRAFGPEQFTDHGPRHFPCAIDVAQLVPLGIVDQLIADPGVEKISRHDAIQWGRKCKKGRYADFTSSLSRADGALPHLPSAISCHPELAEAVDKRRFCSISPPIQQRPSRCSKEARREIVRKRFNWRTFP